MVALTGQDARQSPVLVLQIANVYFAVNNVKPFILAGCAYVSMKNLQTTKMVHFSPLAM